MISIKNLSIKYEQLLAVESISLTIKEGEFVSIIGESGCGKTTILKAIGNLLGTHNTTSISGKIEVNGISTINAKKQRLIGYASQYPMLLPWRNVEKNIQLPLEISKNYDNDLVSSIIVALGLNGFEKSMPNELSGGMRQRVNIARAIVHRPPILLLDEPFGSLDEITRDRINVFYRGLHNANKQTTILVTHSLREALFLSDRIVILTNRPANIKQIFNVNLPSIRDKELFYQLDFINQLKELEYEFYK